MDFPELKEINSDSAGTLQSFIDLYTVLLELDTAGWIWEIESGKVTWSKARYRLFGEDEKNYIPTFESYLTHFDPEEQIKIKRLIKSVLDGKEKYTIEHPIKTADGSIKYIREFGAVIFDADKKPVRMIGFSQDITESKTKEKELHTVIRLNSILSAINQTIVHSQNQNSLFQTICNVVTEIGNFKMAWIGLLDPKDNSVKPLFHAGCDEGYLETLDVKIGHKKLGKGPTGIAIETGQVQICNDILNESSMLPWREHALKRGYRASAAIPFSVNRKIIGTMSLYSIEPGFFSNEEKKLLTSIGESISYGLNAILTEEKRIAAEEKLLQLYRAVEQSPVSIVITDLKGMIEYVNPKFVEVTGYSREEVIGKNPRILKSGHTSSDEYKNLWENITSGIEWKGELHNVKKDGTLFWEEARISPIVNDKGEITHFLAVKEDITERKHIEAERAKLLEEIVYHNKNLEQFAHIVSHNLRAPVSNILGINNLLVSGYLTKQEKEQYCTDLSNEVVRLDSVIIDLNYLLHLNNKSYMNKEDVVFQYLIDEIKNNLDYTIKKESVVFNLNFNGCESIYSVRSYMYSIFLNLISNSIKFKSPDKPPEISIKNYEEKGKIIIEYKDNGIGIDLNVFGNEIFGLYKRFTTGRMNGKGLGLFMVKKQVENLNGGISIDSSPGIGTKFIIELNK